MADVLTVGATGAAFQQGRGVLLGGVACFLEICTFVPVTLE